MTQMEDLHLRVLSLTEWLEDGPSGQDQMRTELLLFPEIQSFGNKLPPMQRLQREIASEVY